MCKPYFIKYTKDWYVNANDITDLRIQNGEIHFVKLFEPDVLVKVDADLAGGFINNLQALNQNISRIENDYHTQIEERDND